MTDELQILSDEEQEQFWTNTFGINPKKTKPNKE
jgi:hypothetical protein